MRAALAAAVFLAVSALYIHTMAPGLPAYRDAGEMVVAAHTLGVAHPPGYPLYTLLARAATAFPLGETAYRVGLLSCVAGAAAAALLAWHLAGSVGLVPALLAAAALGLDPSFWAVATVPEMYSLGILAACGLWVLALGPLDGRASRLLAFLGGLALAVRMDLVLFAPGLALLLWLKRGRAAFAPKPLAVLLAFFALGFSVFAYLPVRSAAGALLDWNHPADPVNLWGSITRRGYGSTLDLLSKNFEFGANFDENLAVWGRHLRATFGVTGLALAAFGAWSARAGLAFWPLALGWALTGPVFLLLGNMPPNPHALAIVDPHYAASDLVLCLFLAYGAAAALDGAALARPALRAARLALVALCAAELALLGAGHHALCRRASYQMEDFLRGALASAPKGSILVAKKDVQIFGLWYAQEVRGLGAHAAVIAQGLAGSPWYQDTFGRRHGVALDSLRELGGWRKVQAANPGRTVTATPDAEVFEELDLSPRGLVSTLGAGAGPEAWALIARRDRGTYESAADFFRADLVDMHAQARFRLAARLLKQEKLAEAERHALAAWTLKWLFPDPAQVAAYAAVLSARPERAAALYRAASRLYDEILALARDYRALPDVEEGLRKAGADPRLNLGVLLERRGDREGAERAYREALSRDPMSAKGWYNLGVLFWEKDWPRAAEAFAKAAALEPANESYRRYRDQAAARVRR